MASPLLARRRFLISSAGAGVAWLAACGNSPDQPASESAAQADKPNVVLIMADDLGYETLGCYGGTSYQTPNLDALAQGGIRFNHAYAQPLCTPTRVQLMTGQYNFRNWKAFGVLDPAETTFGHMMQAAGYKTCISGKWQLWSYNPPDFEPEWRGKGMKPEDSGFDEWRLWHVGHTEDKGSRYADPTFIENGAPVENAKGAYGPDLYTDFICDFMTSHRADPLFVYFPMALTHGPFNPTPESDVWESGNRLQNDPKFFGDMVEHMDLVVGRIVKKLDELGLRENTLLLFYSDNGSPREVASMLGDQTVQGGKGKPTDAGTRVPLIANWPGVTPPGKVLDDLIDSTDFVATLHELCGAKLPQGKTLDGRSFAPQLRGQPGHPKDVIICWHDPRPGVGKEDYTQLDLWARDRRFKLYSDGRLFDVANDVLEENPIPPGTGGNEAETAREKLRLALDQVPA